MRLFLVATAVVCFSVPALAGPSCLSAQVPDADSATLRGRGDSLALALLARARAARGTEASDLQSFEVTVRERWYIGLDAERLRRERPLYREERLARARWERGEPQVWRWVGARASIPVVGENDEALDPGELDEPILRDLDPASERLGVESAEFLHPLADSALAVYRYASGDTTRYLLPELGREITLAEVRFRPDRPAESLLAGSLWFDVESGALVRGVWRPSEPLTLPFIARLSGEQDPDEDAEDVPGFLQPILFDIRFIVVDYLLQDLHWWLIHRVRFEGEARVARLLTFPAAAEIEATDYDVNVPDMVSPPGPLPSGWTRVETDTIGADEGEPPRVMYVPPPDSLRTSPDLVGWLPGPEAVAFDPAEIAAFRGELGRAAGGEGVYELRRVRLAQPRYNRVEALGLGVVGTSPLGRNLAGRAELRIGVADPEPSASAGLRRRGLGGEWELEAYHRLQAANEREDPLALVPSMHAFLLGYDDGQYYRATGGALSWARRTTGWSVRGRVFAEAQRPADKETDASLAYWLGAGPSPPNIEADRLDLAGASLELRRRFGLDPGRPLGDLWTRLEGGAGDREFGRAEGGAFASLPLGPLQAALDAAAGTSFGDLPVQRLWYLGGPATLRGFANGALAGDAYWTARLELSTRNPAVRLIAFGDLGWAGSRSAFGDGGPAASAGLGVSAMDGLLRIDVARSLRGRDPDAVRVYVRLDGLL